MVDVTVTGRAVVNDLLEERGTLVLVADRLLIDGTFYSHPIIIPPPPLSIDVSVTGRLVFGDRLDERGRLVLRLDRLLEDGVHYGRPTGPITPPFKLLREQFGVRGLAPTAPGGPSYG